MPNWTEITLRCDGIENMPLFTENSEGVKELDYNTLVPMPDYTKETIAPLRPGAVLSYLLEEYGKDEALKRFTGYGLQLPDSLTGYKSMNEEEIKKITDEKYELGYGENAREITAYELGKNYVLSKEETGQWEWYEWAYANWGVKWNACDTYIGEGFVEFSAPWGYPGGFFEKLADTFPGKTFTAEMRYEDDYDRLHIIDFSDTSFRESSRAVYDGIIRELYGPDGITAEMEFRLGLYDQKNTAFPPGMKESNVYGIGIQAFMDGEPYGTLTVNLPGPSGEFCEMISLKNCAYVDLLNCPWAGELTERGIATDTGLRKQSGFNEYPLWRFSEEWLKSLEPLSQDRTYGEYEKKHGEAVNPLSGRADGSSFRESLRPAAGNEKDFTYTQERGVLSRSGCIGHLKIDIGENPGSFFTGWTDHIRELKSENFRNEFDSVINTLREDGNILSGRNSVTEYCDNHPEAFLYSNSSEKAYAFRADTENHSYVIRLNSLNENYTAYVYAYEKESLDSYLEYLSSRRNIDVVCVEPGKPAYIKTIPEGLESLQDEVGGLIECVYPWDDDAVIICNEEGKINGLPLNRALRDDDGNIYDALAGTFLVCGITPGDFCSLSEDQKEIYTKMYSQPETILLTGGEVKAFPSSDLTQIPVYMHTMEYAYAHGESSAYALSFRTNAECRNDIESSVTSNYRNNTLDTSAVFREITGKYGEERFRTVLANTCVQKENDGRISTENKEWAAGVPLPECGNMKRYFSCGGINPGLTDLLVTKFRKETGKMIEPSRDTESIKKTVKKDDITI